MTNSNMTVLVLVMYVCLAAVRVISFFFFNDTATTEIYTLSLHDALPIWGRLDTREGCRGRVLRESAGSGRGRLPDRKSTRLNSSHGYISYAVFCLKKKKKKIQITYNMISSIVRDISRFTVA